MLNPEPGRMRRLTLLLIFFLAPANADQTFTHQATGLTFPVDFGALVRTSVEEDEASGSTVVTYNAEKYDDAVFEFTIYPKRRTLAEEFKRVRKSIEEKWKNRKVLARGSLRTSGREGKRRRFRLLDKGGDLFSEARVYDVGSRFFKVQVTGDFKHRKTLEKATTRLVGKISP